MKNSSPNRFSINAQTLYLKGVVDCVPLLCISLSLNQIQSAQLQQWTMCRDRQIFFTERSVIHGCSCRTQQAPDVYVTPGWRWTRRGTDFDRKLKSCWRQYLMSIWCWLNVGFCLHNLKTTKSQRQLTSVLDINLTLTLDVEFTFNFGHLTSQPKFNLIINVLWRCVPAGKALIVIKPFIKS